MLTNHILTPILDVNGDSVDTTFHMPDYGAAECKNKHTPEAVQQDTGSSETYNEDICAHLTTIGGGHRIWTAVHCVNDLENDAGSTASITFFNGRTRTFSTATVGDSTAFVALYDLQGKPIAVFRLHDLHNAQNEREEKRILEAGGEFENGRVDGLLLVTHALGNKHLRSAGVNADATINYWTIEQICKVKGIDPKLVGKVQLIVASDGLTEMVKNEDGNKNYNEKLAQEKHILEILKKHNPQGNLSEGDLAATLVNSAKRPQSRDNLSAIVHTLRQKILSAAIFDGHGPNGEVVSTFAARWIGLHIRRLCAMDEKQYNLEEFSVARHQECYDYANKEIEQKFLQQWQAVKDEVVQPMCLDTHEPVEEKSSPIKTEARQQLERVLKEYLPNKDLSHIANKERLLPFLNNPNLTESINELADEALEKIIRYSDSFQRMVFDAKIPLPTLLKCSDADLQQLFQHEYVIYYMRKANWTWEAILGVVFNPHPVNHELLHHPLSIHLINRVEPALLQTILVDATGDQRKELYDHALEIRWIIEDVIAQLPEINTAAEFLLKWFNQPNEQREEIYKKIRLAQPFFAAKCLGLDYNVINSLNLPMLEELNQAHANTIPFLNALKMSFPDFLTLEPKKIDYLNENLTELTEILSFEHFTWQDFLTVPKDFLTMSEINYYHANQLIENNSLDKKTYFGYSLEQRKFISVNYHAILQLFNSDEQKCKTLLANPSAALLNKLCRITEPSSPVSVANSYASTFSRSSTPPDSPKKSEEATDTCCKCSVS